MSDIKIIGLLLIVILLLVLPFTMVTYGSPAHEKGGFVLERSSFTKIGLTESVLLPICVWYIMFFVMMLYMKSDDEKKSLKNVK